MPPRVAKDPEASGMPVKQVVGFRIGSDSPQAGEAVLELQPGTPSGQTPQYQGSLEGTQRDNESVGTPFSIGGDNLARTPSMPSDWRRISLSGESKHVTSLHKTRSFQGGSMDTPPSTDRSGRTDGNVPVHAIFPDSAGLQSSAPTPPPHDASTAAQHAAPPSTELPLEQLYSINSARSGSKVPRVSAATAASESSAAPAKMTKAERRALQEAQRAKKDAAKIENGGNANANRKLGRTGTKELPSRMSGDIKGLVESKAADASKAVAAMPDSVPVMLRPSAMFSHLPTYKELGADSVLKHKEKIHPAVLQVGLGYANGSIRGSTARSVAMMLALKSAIRSYVTPEDKAFSRAVTSYINVSVAFLWEECRPGCVPQRNSVKWLKKALMKIPHDISEAEAKDSILRQIDDFVHEKFVMADQVLAQAAVSKIEDGDVIMTYAHSSVVLNVFLQAKKEGKEFEVVCVDGRPHFDGEVMCKRLLAEGICCTYMHLNAIAFAMRFTTKVLLGASAVKSNGAVVSRSGTAVVAMAAHVAHKPVLICAQSIKFHEDVQLDSITANEQGNPADMLQVRNNKSTTNELQELSRDSKMSVLNLVYDVMPMEFITLIVTEFGLIPPTSVPVILREKRDDDLA